MDYGFEHDGTIHTPNKTTGIAAADNASRNASIEAAELAAWARQPDRFYSLRNPRQPRRDDLARDTHRRRGIAHAVQNQSQPRDYRNRRARHQWRDLSWPVWLRTERILQADEVQMR